MCDLHSHMPGGVWGGGGGGVVLCRRVTMEQHGDAASGGDVKYLSRVRSQVDLCLKVV